MQVCIARKPMSYGIEALALLPTSSDGGAGVEASLLATYRTDRLRVHLNAAGFYDARPADAKSGWKGGVLGEVVFGRVRPGIELFAKQVFGEDTQVLAGVGAIVGVTQQLDVRVGMHAGVTDAAPDVVASLWIAGKVPVQ